MANVNILGIIPDAQGLELSTLQNLTKSMSQKDAENFLNNFSVSRKSYGTACGLCILGLFIPLGIFRFWVNNAGLGILYLLTLELFWIGALVDIFTYKSTTEQFNVRLAHTMSAGLSNSNTDQPSQVIQIINQSETGSVNANKGTQEKKDNL